MPQPTQLLPPGIGHRILSRCRQTASGCLEFMGSRQRGGYGHVGIRGRGDGFISTHRAMWILSRGEIPDGMYICHTCDNPPCCNVEHLFLGTPADNTRDMVSKGRATRGSMTKLTVEQVREVRILHQSGRSYSALARQFGLSVTTVRHAVLRHTWKSVE